MNDACGGQSGSHRRWCAHGHAPRTGGAPGGGRAGRGCSCPHPPAPEAAAGAGAGAAVSAAPGRCTLRTGLQTHRNTLSHALVATCRLRKESEIVTMQGQRNSALAYDSVHDEMRQAQAGTDYFRDMQLAAYQKGFPVCAAYLRGVPLQDHCPWGPGEVLPALRLEAAVAAAAAAVGHGPRQRIHPARGRTCLHQIQILIRSSVSNDQLQKMNQPSPPGP